MQTPTQNFDLTLLDTPVEVKPSGVINDETHSTQQQLRQQETVICENTVDKVTIVSPSFVVNPEGKTYHEIREIIKDDVLEECVEAYLKSFVDLVENQNPDPSLPKLTEESHLTTMINQAEKYSGDLIADYCVTEESGIDREMTDLYKPKTEYELSCSKFPLPALSPEFPYRLSFSTTHMDTELENVTKRICLVCKEKHIIDVDSPSIAHKLSTYVNGLKKSEHLRPLFKNITNFEISTLVDVFNVGKSLVSKEFVPADTYTVRGRIQSVVNTVGIPRCKQHVYKFISMLFGLEVGPDNPAGYDVLKQNTAGHLYNAKTMRHVFTNFADEFISMYTRNGPHNSDFENDPYFWLYYALSHIVAVKPRFDTVVFGNIGLQLITNDFNPVHARRLIDYLSGDGRFPPRAKNLGFYAHPLVPIDTEFCPTLIPESGRARVESACVIAPMQKCEVEEPRTLNVLGFLKQGHCPTFNGESYARKLQPAGVMVPLPMYNGVRIKQQAVELKMPPHKIPNFHLYDRSIRNPVKVRYPNKGKSPITRLATPYTVITCPSLAVLRGYKVSKSPKKRVASSTELEVRQRLAAVHYVISTGIAADPVEERDFSHGKRNYTYTWSLDYSHSRVTSIYRYCAKINTCVVGGILRDGAEDHYTFSMILPSKRIFNVRIERGSPMWNAMRLVGCSNFVSPYHYYCIALGAPIINYKFLDPPISSIVKLNHKLNEKVFYSMYVQLVALWSRDIALLASMPKAQGYFQKFVGTEGIPDAMAAIIETTNQMKSVIESFVPRAQEHSQNAIKAARVAKVLENILSLGIAVANGYLHGSRALAMSLTQWAISLGPVSTIASALGNLMRPANANAPSNNPNVLEAMWICITHVLGCAQGDARVARDVINSFDATRKFTSGVTYFVDFFQHGISYLVDLLGLPNPFTKKPSINSRIKAYCDKFAEMFKGDIGMEMHPDSELFREIDALYKEGLEISALLYRADRKIAATFSPVHQRFETLRGEILRRAKTSATRVPPIVIHLIGEPGNGKSTLAPYIARDLAAHKGYTNFSRNLIYEPSKTSDFEDAYRNQPITLIDDWLQIRDKAALNKMAMSIIEKNNTVNVPMNMAAVEFKGRVFWDGFLILLTSNSKPDNPLGGSADHFGIQDLGALERRIDFTVAVSYDNDCKRKVGNNSVVCPLLVAGKYPDNKLGGYNLVLIEGQTQTPIVYEDLILLAQKRLDANSSVTDPFAELSQPKPKVINKEGVPWYKVPINWLRSLRPHAQAPPSSGESEFKEDDLFDQMIEANTNDLDWMSLSVFNRYCQRVARDVLQNVNTVCAEVDGLFTMWRMKYPFFASIFEITAIAGLFTAVLTLIYVGIRSFASTLFGKDSTEVPDEISLKEVVVPQSTVKSSAARPVMDKYVPQLEKLPLAQAMSDTWRPLFSSRISPNRVILQFSVNGNLMTGKYKALGICDRLIVFPRHYLAAVPKEACIIINRLDKQYIKPISDLHDHMVMVKPDLVFLRYPDKTFPMFNDISKYFCSRDTILNADLSQLVIQRRINNDDMFYGARGVLNAANTYMDDFGNVYSSEYIITVYNLVGEPGDCGTVVMRLSQDEREKIVGIHVAGHHAQSMIMPVFSEVVEAVCNHFSGVAQSPSWLPEDVKIVCTVPNEEATFLGGESRVTRTQMFPETVPTHGPPRFDLHDGVSPLQVSFAKFGKPNPHEVDELDRALLEEITQEFVNYTNRIESKKPKKVLAIEEVINGKRGWTYVPAIHMDTARGHPWTHKYPGKGKEPVFIKTQAKNHIHYDPIPELREAYFNNLEYLKAGIEPTWYFSCFLKDEKLPLEKIQAGKCRVASSAPVDHLMIGKALFGHMLETCYTNPTPHNVFAVDINPHSSQWKFIYSDLNRFPYKMAGDAKKFDASLIEPICKAVIRAICLYCDPTLGTYYTACETYLNATVLHTKFLARNYVFDTQRPQNPSGQFLTTFFNCMYNYFLHLLAIKRHAYPENMSLQAIHSNHAFKFCGDDVAHTTIDKSFNHFVKRDLFAKYGMTYTLSDKGEVDRPYDTWETFTFLKRTFRPDRGLVFAPMAEENLREILLWYMDNKIPEKYVVEASCVSICIEWYHYGPVRHLIETSKICKEYELRYGMPLFIHSWHLLHENFIHNGLDLQDRAFLRLRNVPYVPKAQSEGARVDDTISTTTRSTGLTAYNDIFEIEEVSMTSKRIEDNPFLTPNVNEILTREYPVHSFAWSTADIAGTMLHNLDSPYLLSSIPIIREVLNRYVYMRADTVFSARVNGLPYHSGAMMFSFLPFYNEASPRINHMQNMYQASCCDTLIVTPNTNDVQSIVIPYNAPQTYWDIHNQNPSTTFRGCFVGIRAWVLNRLRVSNAAAANTLTVTVYMRFTNVEIVGYRPGAQGWKERLASLGDKISTVKDFKKHVSMILTPKPSSVVRGVGNVVADIMEASGYCKPNDVTGITRVLVTSENTSNCDDRSEATPLQLYQSASLANDSTILNLDNINYDLFDNYKLLPMMFAVGTISSTQLVGHRVMHGYITPNFEVVLGGAHYRSFIKQLHDLHNFWRGSIKLCFRFAGSMMNSCRVRLVVYYGTFAPLTMDFNTIGNVPSKVVDIAGDTTFTVNIPYLTRRPYTSGHIGEWAIFIENPPSVQPDGNDQIIDFSAWVAGGEDLVFSCPITGIDSRPTFYPTVARSQSSSTHMRTLFMSPFPPIMPARHIIKANLCVTDITSKWTDLFSRYHQMGTAVFTYTNGTSNVLQLQPLTIMDSIFSGGVPPVGWTNLLTTFFWNFANHSGSFRITVVGSRAAATNTEISQTGAIDYNSGVAIFNSRNDATIVLSQYDGFPFRNPNYVGFYSGSVGCVRKSTSTTHASENIVIILGTHDDYMVGLPVPPRPLVPV